MGNNIEKFLQTYLGISPTKLGNLTSGRGVYLDKNGNLPNYMVGSEFLPYQLPDMVVTNEGSLNTYMNAYPDDPVADRKTRVLFGKNYYNNGVGGYDPVYAPIAGEITDLKTGNKSYWDSATGGYPDDSNYTRESYIYKDTSGYDQERSKKGFDKALETYVGPYTEDYWVENRKFPYFPKSKTTSRYKTFRTSYKPFKKK